MPLVTIRDLSIGFQGPPLLESVSCHIESGQRIGLLGRNGAGKTTFMRILAGQQEPDAGEVIIETGRRVALLQQDVPQDVFAGVSEVVSQGLAGRRDDSSWLAANAVEQILSRMELDGAAKFQQLSSGMKRRVLLGRALVGEPDMLLLDEPTNHLDITAIEWLEQFLLRFGSTLMFVTHDRMFLRRMATRILEIDRGRLFDWSCDYETFLRRKEQALAAEEKENALFDKRLALQETWIRTGIKARRTRNEGRVKALKKLRQQRKRRREKLATSNLQIHQVQKSGQLVIEASEISFGYEGQAKIIDRFSTSIMRGDKVGIIGRNGAGKSTLLKILLGKLAPQTGKIKQGTNLQIAYFDQLREQLDDQQTVEENVGEGNDVITLGTAQKHIYGYLADFLFTPARARTRIKFLSGGERNRILLAKLFARPANLIVLDEPTNDLDAETLEMLEDRLVAFAGTCLLVSHDREFLNNVVTSSIVFENASINEYFGGYDDWIQQRPPVVTTSRQKAKPAARKPAQALTEKLPRRLKFAEKQELAELPQKIDSLESSIAELHQAMANPDFYQQPAAVLSAKQAELKQMETDLNLAYQRWEELEALEA